jgi:hypothetical protein
MYSPDTPHRYGEAVRYVHASTSKHSLTIDMMPDFRKYLEYKFTVIRVFQQLVKY